jgi:pimeloyl-ACP methyl ester carboxylesterase
MTAHWPDVPDAIRSQWPYRPRFVRVNGWRMHYVDEGAGEPVVLLHGNPTWGFLYRDFVAPLTRAGYRVIIPDMIGFGLSEKPTREDAHGLDGHIANLTALVRQLDLEHITLVCHDWGGPTGLGFALSNRERMHALVLMSTWAWPLPPTEFHTRMFPWRIMHAPLLGPYLLGRHNVLCGTRHLSVRSGSGQIPRARAGRLYGGSARSGDAPLDLDVAALDPARRPRPRVCALLLDRARAARVQATGAADLGPRGRRVRPRNVLPKIQGAAAARRRTPSRDRPAFLAGGFRTGDRRPHR